MRPHRFAGVVLAFALAAATSPAQAAPLDFLPVGDPLEDEIRILDVLGTPDSLPHLGMRPLQIAELPPCSAPSSRSAAAITRARVRRALARDRAIPDTVAGSSPRLLQLSYPEGERVEASVALEGSGASARGRDPDFTSPSGAHVRLGVQVDRWNLHTHLVVGHVAHGLDFAPPIVGRNDAVLHSDEAYLSYTGAAETWAVQIGRSHWQWGPGDDAGLLLSKTSAALTGMALHLRVRPLRADGMILWVALDEAAGQQLAAHRLEWQPASALRLGVSEAVRYHSAHWEPLYGVGVLPYALVQELLIQDQPDSAQAVHNNVLAAVDAAWRIRPGAKVYGELLIDDLRTNGAPVVSKFGYLLGCEGVVSAAGRIRAGLEYARLTRFVYTSSFGEAFVAQGEPLGYPTGPDTRRIRLRGSWDPTAAWQAYGDVARTDAGESGLDQVFHPGDPLVRVTDFLGVVEHTTDAELGLRWWPAAGLDVSVAAQMRRVENAGHVTGARTSQPGGELRLRIVR